MERILVRRDQIRTITALFEIFPVVEGIRAVAAKRMLDKIEPL